MAHKVYIALGSNLGYRLNFLRKAVEALNEILTQVKTSIVLETEALLLENSPENWNRPFLNMIVSGKTDLMPLDLLEKLKAIECQLGRSPSHQPWSPRTIDLDLLLYDDLILTSEKLTLPHKELLNRDFLLHLLASMAPREVHPVLKRSFESLAQEKLAATKAVFYRSFSLYPQLVGIVNVTPDSFSDGGQYFNPEAAIKHCHQLIQDGASVLDLGAQSTRPGAPQLSAEEEWRRLCPVLDGLNLNNIPVSIDTYRDDLVEKLLEKYPIAWINDVSGALKEPSLKLLAQAGCKLCTMHSLSIPPKKTENIETGWATLDAWCKKQIDLLTHCGFALNDIVLDPGFGFGKTPYTTGFLLKTIEHMRQWHCPIYIGHSRKSFYGLLGQREPQDRDIETLAVSQLLKTKVDYLRVHNVALLQRLLTAQHWIENCDEY